MRPQAEKLSIVSGFDEYCSQCTFDGNGEIYNRDSKILWRFKTQHRHNRALFSCAVFQFLPDFAFYDVVGQKLLEIKCEQRYPLTRFVMLVNGMTVCTIRQQSILLKNKYTLEFNSGLKWNFHMPLFSVFYKGISETGAEIRVRLLRHDTWHVQIAPSLNNLHLIAGLALIHRERQRFA